MNFDEMKRMMNIMDGMNGKSPIDIISEQNPRVRHMQSAINNPADTLSKMGMSGFANGGLDISQMMNMMNMFGGMNNRGNKEKQSSPQYFGLSPIAGFASPEIIYALNKYLSLL